MATQRAMSLREIEEEAEKDLELHADRTAEESARIPTLFNKYYQQYRLVKTEMILMETHISRLRRQKWYYYSGKADPEVYREKPLDVKLMKNDIKMHIDSDPEVVDLTERYKLLELKKDTLKAILDVIGKQTYMINNIIKTLYFKHGIV